MEDKLVRFTRPGLTEEYSVSVDGVRQDFIIESPPLNPQRSTLNQSVGDLRVELALSGARAEATAYGARLRLDGSGRALAYSRLRVEDATGRELTARLEVLSPDRLAVSVADANATYPVRIDPTFSDADWVSLNPGLPGANGDGEGHRSGRQWQCVCRRLLHLHWDGAGQPHRQMGRQRLVGLGLGDRAARSMRWR